MTVAESFKRFRKNYGITQQQVADALGIKQQSYQVYENKNVIPSANVIIKLATTFNVSADYLLGLSDVPKNPKISDADKELVESVITCKNALQKVLDSRGFGN